MKNLIPRVSTALLLGAASAVAQAQGTVAFTARESQLFAGPSPDYPLVAVLAGGVQVAVQGCLPDYTWCDVTVGVNRGWLYAGDIDYPYQGSVLPLLTYGGAIGVGVLGFSLNDYWGSYYRARPWYRERNQWLNRPYFRPVPPWHGPGADRQRPHIRQDAGPIQRERRGPQTQGRESRRDERREGDRVERGDHGERGDRGDRGQDRGEHEGRGRR
jgi:uncharacterized protein YraI